MKYTEISTSDNKNGSSIPAGKYLCQIKEATETTSKKEVPMIKVKLEIVDGEFTGKNIYDQLAFNCARPKTLHRALGFYISREFEILPEEWIDRLVWVQVENETYSGTLRSKVSFEGYEKVKSKIIIETLERLKALSELEEPEDEVDEDIDLNSIYEQYKL